MRSRPERIGLARAAADAAPRSFFAALAGSANTYANWLAGLRRQAFMRAGVPSLRTPDRKSKKLPLGMRFAGDGLMFGALMAFLVKASERAAFGLWFPPSTHGWGVRIGFDILALVSGLAVWMVARLSRGVRPFVEPPVQISDTEPLASLEAFVERLTQSTQGLRHAYTLLLWAVSAVGAMIALWSMALVLHGDGRFARVLGGSLAFATSFVCVNWRPWHPMQALREAESLATAAGDALGYQLGRLERIRSDEARLDAEWEYLAQQLNALPRE